MNTLFSLLRTSAGGSLELFVLCSAGAFLARNGILDKAACSSWSRAIFNIFLPSLLFTSILETIYRTKTLISEEQNSFEILFPAIWALVTFLSSALVGSIVIAFLHKDKGEPIKRILFISLLLGNTNNLPILLLNNLCHNYDQLQDDYDCSLRGVSYVAVFMAVWNSLMWTVALSYLMTTPSTASQTLEAPPIERAISQITTDEDENCTDDSILVGARSSTQHSPSLLQSLTQMCNEWQTKFRSSIVLEKLFSPPFIAILISAFLGNIPFFGNLFLENDAPLKNVKDAIDLLGKVVVPCSSLIVGARLYTYFISKYWKPLPSSPNNTENCSEKTEIALTHVEIIGMVLTRFVILPIVGRVLYKALLVDDYIYDPLLRLYLLIPFFMPTASNSVVMVQMVSVSLPELGPRMESVLLTLIFWQYAVAPFFLTANLALSIAEVFGTEMEV